MFAVQIQIHHPCAHEILVVHYNKFPLYFISAMLVVHYATCSSDEPLCQPLVYDYCRPIIGNMTKFPNVFGHETQIEAAMAMNELFPFVRIQCSVQIKWFLCSLYFPYCVRQLSVNVFPCQRTCERVRDDCFEAFQNMRLPWPEKMNCSKFARENTERQLCMEFGGYINHWPIDDVTNPL